MPFSATELANIANATLDNFIGKGEVYKQTIQNKPFLKAMDSAASDDVSGGNGKVSLRIKGEYDGVLQGYSHDDTAGYYNPANIKRVEYSWKEHHIGLEITHTELKHDGITVSGDGADESTSEKDGREEHALANLLDDKMEDMNESYSRGLNTLLWGDGTADAKALAGIRSFILEVPTTGTTGGLNRAFFSWWRNRAATAAFGSAGGRGSVSSNVANGGAAIQFFQNEFRQLNRYGGTGSAKIFAGSDAIDKIEKEFRANGKYTEDGFRRESATDGGMATIYLGGKPVTYDPTLDDLSLSDRLYVVDMKRIKLRYMKGEKMKRHSPARPHDKYAMYRAITTTAVMTAQQLNTSGVYQIA